MRKERFTDAMSERAENAVRARFPQLMEADVDLVPVVVQTVLIYATETGERLRPSWRTALMEPWRGWWVVSRPGAILALLGVLAVGLVWGLGLGLWLVK